MEASKSADGADAITVGFQTVNFPATCSVNGNTNAVTAAAGSDSGNTAQTGASVLPYVHRRGPAGHRRCRFPCPAQEEPLNLNG